MTIYARVRKVAMVGGVEAFGVAAAGIAGLLIVNVLPKDQYAVYTFLITCMQLVLGITDLGLSKCVLPIVGQRAGDVAWVAGVCHQIFSRRWLLLGCGLILVVPYGLHIFWDHGWRTNAYFLSAVLMLVVVLLTLRNHYASTVLVVLQRISTTSRVALIVTILRTAIVCIVLLLPVTSYTITLLVFATVIAEAMSVVIFRRVFTMEGIGGVRLRPAEREGVDRQILRIAIPLVPSTIFFHVQGVVTVFLVSLFGTTEMLAEIGAIGRLSLALLVVDRIAGTLLFPAIAREQTGSRLAGMIVKTHAVYIGLMACMLVSGIFLPHCWIWLLGEKYTKLEPFVGLMFLSIVLMSCAGMAFQTLAVRGWTKGQSYGIVFVLILQILYLWVRGITNLPSVLWFNVITCMGHFLFQYFLVALRWSSFTAERTS